MFKKERELAECREELAAAEARVKRALEVLSRIPPDSPIHGKDMRILRYSETGALETALEQARVEERELARPLFEAVKKAMDEEYELSERTCDMLWKAWCAYGLAIREADGY